jgi:hypothetical protein
MEWNWTAAVLALGWRGEVPERTLLEPERSMLPHQEKLLLVPRVEREQVGSSESSGAAQLPSSQRLLGCTQLAQDFAQQAREEHKGTLVR